MECNLISSEKNNQIIALIINDTTMMFVVRFGTISEKQKQNFQKYNILDYALQRLESH